MGASVSLYRTTATALGIGGVEVAGLDLRRYDQIARVSGDGSLSDVTAGGAAIDDATAQRHGLSVGDRLTVSGRTFRVAFVADLRNVPFANVIVPPEEFRALFPDIDEPEQFAVDAAEGVPVADARAAIEAVVVFAWAAVATIPNLVFTVPWGRLGLCAVAAGMLGLLASVVPARLSPVAALATE